mgnify:FL=1
MSLFRSEVFEAKKNRWTGQIVLVRPFSLFALTLFAVCLAAALIAFAAFGSYTNKTTVEGQLVPLGGVVRVYAPETGVITDKKVADGDFVRAGDVLFTLSTARSDGTGSVQARLAVEAKLKKTLAEQDIARQKRIHANEKTAQENTLRRLRQQLLHVQDQIAVQQKRIALNSKMLAKQNELVRQGALSELERTNYENMLLGLKADLAAYQREESNLAREIAAQQSNLDKLPEQQANEISQLERTLAAYNQEILDYGVRDGQTIRAAVSGYANAVNAEVGQQADASRLLASIVPQTVQLQANLYVPSRAVGFVKPGDKVVLRYQAYPYQKFGHATGRIVSIAQTALNKQELANLGNIFTNPALLNEPAYLVKVKLGKQTILVYGKETKLPIGMTAEADILHENKKLYEWMLDPLYSVAGKVKQ